MTAIGFSRLKLLTRKRSNSGELLMLRVEVGSLERLQSVLAVVLNRIIQINSRDKAVK